MTKKCTKCKKNKPVAEFRKRGASLHSWCRGCENAGKNAAYHKNPKSYNERIIAYRGKDRERWLQYAREYRQKQKAEAVAHYGGKCACCKEKRLVFLCIDHINGGGGKHLKSIKIGFYRWLKQNNYPKGFQVLCWNCNAAKHILGKCPHHK